MAAAGSATDTARLSRWKKRSWMDALKRRPCARCGECYPPYVMDWHHRDPTTKDRRVRLNGATTCSRARIIAEIAKCDLLCANCHRIVEHGDA